jgi:hypothetical protein
MGKIKAGLGAAGAVLVVAEWLMISHVLKLLIFNALPH